MVRAWYIRVITGIVCRVCSTPIAVFRNALYVFVRPVNSLFFRPLEVGTYQGILYARATIGTSVSSVRPGHSRNFCEFCTPGPQSELL